MARRLSSNVAVGGVWYGPDHGNADQVPDDVAAGIADHLWDGDVDKGDEAAASPKPSARRPRQS